MRISLLCKFLISCCFLAVNLSQATPNKNNDNFPDFELNLMCEAIDSVGEVSYKFPLLISYGTIDLGLESKTKEPLTAIASDVKFPANTNIKGALLKRTNDYILFTGINEIDKGYERFTEVTLYQLNYKKLTKKDRLIGRELVGIATSGRLFDADRKTRNLRCSFPIF